MTRFTLFLSVLLGWLAAGPTAQAQSLNIAAPNTAALGRHGDYPVNLSTGVPEISIPLYTIQTKDITVPITLSYHASGIKVSDVASWVGLGWSLNAGGAIRRKVQGKPDESSEGYLAPAIPIRSDIQPSVSCCVQTNVDYLRDVMINAKDGQPDVFRYNFPGGDGSFVFNKQGQAINIPLSPTRVSYQRLTPSGAFAQFDLTASNGTQFTFQGAEGGASNGLSSAWVLNKIRSPYNDEVNFAYQANSSVSSYSRPPDRLTVRDQYIATGQASCASLQSGVLPVITGSQQIEQYQEQLLDEITFAQGRVKFFAVADRQDWLVTNKRLSAIEVQVRHPVTGAYQLLRRIEFGHGYFIEGQASNSQGKRLKLNQVVIKGNDGAVVQTYRFEYDERPLPSPNTTAKDYWGYYNGKTSNKDLIPNRSIPFIGNGGQLQQLPIGTNNHPQGRDADPAFMQVGVLKRMYYPTGGFTDFEYETNRYLDPATQALTYAGGLRVKKITSHPLSGQAVSKIYKYGLNESGLGRPNALNTSPTNPFLFTNVSTKKRNVITGPCTLFGESLRERTISSDPITELDAYDGTSVFYEYVTEYLGNENGEQGKTVYKFSDVQDFVRFLPRSSSRPYRESRHWLRGRLLEKTVFKQGDNCSFKAVAQTQNVYSTNLISYDNAGIVVGQHTEDIGEVAQCSPTQPAYCGNYEWFNYSVATGDNLLTSTTETLYDQGPTNNTLVNTTTYTYNNFQQLVRTQTTDSKGEALTSETRYPTDYNLTAPNPTPAAAALLALQAQNRVGTPVEQFSYKGSLANGNRRVLGASAYVYQRNPAAPDQVVLGQAYTLETAQPRLWNNQWNDNFAPLIGADGNLPATVPAHYPRKVDNVRFDARGTVLETAPVDGVRMATLYAYKGTTPVAQMAHNEAVPVQPPPGNQQVQATLFNPAYTAVWTAFPNLQTFTLAGPNQVIVTVDMGCLTPGCPPLGSGLCSYQFEMALQNTANPALLYPAIASTSTGGNCGFRTVSNQVALPAGTYRLVWKAPVASGPSSYQISPRVVIPGVVATPGQNYWHYTSFEEGPNEGTGTDPRIVPGGKTGRYAYNLGGGGSLALPGNWLALANGKKYTLSYWYQTAVGGPWLLFEQKYLPSALPASLTQAGTGALRVDELRVFPEDAMVSTLTADPLVGVTSTADENNLTASTEYDAAQRPRLAREQDGNIVKKWEYQFTTDSTTPASQAGAINWATETWNIPIAQEVFVTALADLDNNGTKDLAILNRSAQSVRFFRYKPNCANGEWEEGAPLVVPNEAGVVNITVGDYNQDGTPDLALILHPPNINSNARLQIRLGNGSPFVPGGSYSIAATYNLGPRWATQLIQTDLNLDGKLDLVATRLSLEPENERLYWFMGQGDGTFTRNAVNVGATDIQAAWDVAAGDLNGDGWPDLALPVGHSNYIYIYPNNKQGGFDPPILFNATHPQAGTSSQFHFIKLADLNQDGKLDMMGTSHQNTMNIVSFINQGNFTFTKNNLVVYSDLTNLFQLSQPGDYNQDGKIDLMVNRRDGIYLYPGQGDGTFANTPVFAAPVLATQYWQNTYTMQYRDFGTPQDVNGDGILDLVLTHPGKVSIYLGQRGAVTTTPLANPSYVREHTYLAKVADEASLAGLTTAAGQVLTGTQYYDGLGRPLQAVGHQLSPELKDVVQPVAYDPYGRQPRAYLPYTVAPNLANRYRANALGGANYPASEQFAFYNPANAAANPTVAKDNFPFADTDFERSPLSRPLRQGAPGADWQMPTQPWDFTPNQATDHTVKAFGRANTAADQVRILRVDGLDPANLAWPVIAANVGQYYAPGQLWVTTSHDEDNKTLHQFTDRLGRPVLKRVETGDPARPWAETAYVYDDQERLVAVLQPEAVKLVRDANAANAAVSINKFTRYAYLYVYDARGRLIHHLTPDQAENNWTSLVYDRRDRPVLSQGPRYVGTGQWHVTKYDHLDRPVLTGWATLANQTRAQLQTTLDGATHAYEVRSNAADSRWGHSNRTFPALAANQVFTASYYDLYDLDGDGQPDPGLAPSASPALNAAEVQPTTSLAHRGRAVASRRARLQGESSTVPGTVYQDLVYYDKYGRPVQTQADNHSGGRETASLWFDYAGRLRRSQQVHLRSLTALPVVTDQRFTLDHVGRPLRVFQRVTANGQVQPEVLTAALTYNELGQMVQKQLHATDSCTFAQAIDYRYTLRGWLKSINGEDAPATSAKLFRFRLTYQDHTDAARRRYNGNITSTEWQTAQAGQNNVRRGYDYTYDAMNRLLAANYKVLNPGGNTPGPAPLPGENHTVDNLTYDRNGNLLTLRRYGATTGTPDPQTGRVNATAHGVVDQLTYAYTAGSNRLLNVTDATPTANNFGGQTWRADFHDGGYGNPDYLYDAAGNLTADGNRGLSGVLYNYLDLPYRQNGTDYRTTPAQGSRLGQVQTDYDAAGGKLQKRVLEYAWGTTTVTKTTTTDYHGGLVYTTVDGLPAAAPDFMAFADGRVVNPALHPTGLPGGVGFGHPATYEYHYTDHQGNLRHPRCHPRSDGYPLRQVARRGHHPLGQAGQPAPGRATRPIAHGWRVDIYHRYPTVRHQPGRRRPTQDRRRRRWGAHQQQLRQCPCPHRRRAVEHPTLAAVRVADVCVAVVGVADVRVPTDVLQLPVPPAAATHERARPRQRRRPGQTPAPAPAQPAGPARPGEGPLWPQASPRAGVRVAAAVRVPTNVQHVATDVRVADVRVAADVRVPTNVRRHPPARRHPARAHGAVLQRGQPAPGRAPDPHGQPGPHLGPDAPARCAGALRRGLGGGLRRANGHRLPDLA